ncbi:MAG TPA: TetR/AcrR family transcriptional regulator [Duganella sp.]|jgi:AcrR family transcriptional regulator
MKVRTEARRQAIIAAAAELFQEAGYEGASMNELAKRLGGSKATLYGYFPSKEELFGAVVRTVATNHLFDATRELTSDIVGRTALEMALIHFGERMLYALTNEKSATDVYRMVVAEAGRSDVGRLFYEAGPSESITILASVLEGAMARGEIRRVDTRVAAMQYTALVTAEVTARIFQQDPPPLALKEIQQMVTRAADCFFAGMTPR